MQTARQFVNATEAIKEANAKHHAHLAALRQARKNRDTILQLFDFDDCVSRARAEQENAYRNGQLRGLPSVFGAFA